MSPTVFRAKGMRSFFLVGEEGEAKVWVEPGIELARNHRLPDKTLNAAMDLIKEREDEIRKAWDEHFGR